MLITYNPELRTQNLEAIAHLVLYLVCYDIVKDNRRTKVAKLLEARDFP
ncbi:MAG: CRISPR-associated endonuclease Cas2 [Cyanobacteriota bacterium]|nr:CRISPR-associated endonuclease Cas2 [Cyanobacteriota bacterium]